MNSGEPAGLYLHVPFCRSKCHYCDFYSVASRAAVPAWLQAIKREVRQYREAWPVFDSLYLGGGTPTILGEAELAALMACLHRDFTFHPDSEMTIEANPDDLSRPTLQTLRELGLNRISLGVQSLDDRDLAYLGRKHSADQALRALELIHSVGWPQVGVDLMYGIEGQTLAAWKRTLDRVLSFRPEHLSCYQLTLAPGTPLGKRQADGRVRAIGERWEAAFFIFTSRYLERYGYRHYEISNFARSRETMCRHNRKYWRHVPYLGLGPSAHSFRAGRRWWNVRSITRYCQLLAAGQAPVEASETLTHEQLSLEALALGFRTSRGVALALAGNRPGGSRTIAMLQQSRLATVHHDRLQPTRRGFLVADSLPLMFDAEGSLGSEMSESLQWPDEGGGGSRQSAKSPIWTSSGFHST